ncbi:ABC transporter ATP-binding protein [Arthrobacter sp. Helios]|uniref:ABC transporter ATP-binding protein n=1 Tax=Arthrobacter sp. Helios TaxID=2828862 RepID=UPI00205A503B|nr:ABC transporter ATP-binding protein [Arthrobacter sp. Helios]UPO77382.1 ABC transporter ATP-binding protein [Arthrobacter sp. Helios]
MSTPAAEFVNVSQNYGGSLAVDSINLQIEEGKLTTLLGPSGCGKTTSLRMLAGYLQPTAGQIIIGGSDATKLPPEKRNLGMVFQSYALFPHLTIADNVGYGLKLRKVPAAERKARIAECLDMVGLGHLAERKPKALSGGQQQRVALARAIAIRPRLLLLDEPLSNLDARLRVQMRAEIRRIQSETGLTVVLVTHDQDEALEMSDSMVLMRAGKIEQTGSPSEIFTRPGNRFVADFLGYENFLELPARGLVTVRPEHLRLVAPDQPAADGGVLLDAVVTSVAYRGTDEIVTAAAGGNDLKVAVHRNSQSASLPALRPGDPVTISAAAGDIVSLPDDVVPSPVTASSTAPSPAA